MSGGTKDSSITTVLATDCGSTTTKAILFEKLADGWHATFRGEAPTTVEPPVADVTIGAINSFRELEELSGRKLLNDRLEAEACPLLPKSASDAAEGVDLYVSTSSAGGGLQMIVAGVVSSMTTESAERAALGAGAIVMDAISIDDGRESHERVQKIRHLRPDIILIAGGTEGGTVDHPLELSETVLQADPRPRFGETIKLPVIYAANSAAREEARQILEKHFAFSAVENLRPSLEEENLGPARDAIHEIFLNHVMSHAPGYKKLLSWVSRPILPTPAAFGDMVQAAAREWDISVIAVDIGGATTDVFSVFKDEEQNQVFNRTVSANLGMSYSVANVLLEAGEAAIRRWLPFEISPEEIRDRLRNKMIRPTTIPQTLEDLILEQAVCREALRLAFEHHKRLAVGLKGTKRKRTIGDIFRQTGAESLVNLLECDLIIGSGGVLSHAPNRNAAALMLIDAYQPLGVTRLAVDSVFMMPHLGVLASVNQAAAAEVFIRDCIIELGTVIAPIGPIKNRNNGARIEVEGRESVQVKAGELTLLELKTGEERKVRVVPLSSDLNFGAGAGKNLEAVVRGGLTGLIIDLRGRPIGLSANAAEQGKQVENWHQRLGVKTK